MRSKSDRLREGGYKDRSVFADDGILIPDAGPSTTRSIANYNADIATYEEQAATAYRRPVCFLQDATAAEIFPHMRFVI